MKKITTAVAMTARRQRQLSQLIPMDARDAFEIINELHFSNKNWLETVQDKEMPATTYHHRHHH